MYRARWGWERYRGIWGWEGCGLNGTRKDGIRRSVGRDGTGQGVGVGGMQGAQVCEGCVRAMVLGEGCGRATAVGEDDWPRQSPSVLPAQLPQQGFAHGDTSWLCPGMRALMAPCSAAQPADAACLACTVSQQPASMMKQPGKQSDSVPCRRSATWPGGLSPTGLSGSG